MEVTTSYSIYISQTHHDFYTGKTVMFTLTPTSVASLPAPGSTPSIISATLSFNRIATRGNNCVLDFGIYGSTDSFTQLSSNARTVNMRLSPAILSIITGTQIPVMVCNCGVNFREAGGVLTIVYDTEGIGGIPTYQQSLLRCFDGNEWQPALCFVYDGSNWIKCLVRYWNGAAWSER